MPPQRIQQIEKWTRVKGLSTLIGIAALSILFLTVKGNHPGSQDSNAPAAPSIASSSYTSPAASVLTPSASPATVDASTQPSPQASPPNEGSAAAPADTSADAAALAATLERLRAERSRAEAASQSNPSQQRSSQTPADQAQAPPQPGPIPTNQIWPHATSTGTRWRLKPRVGEYVLFVDLGDDQVASIHVAPQFQNVESDAMNVRVDWLKSQIIQAHSARSASYQYTRDSSIYPIP